MTQKDFIQIAGIIRAMPTHSASLRTARESCARAFATGLAMNHPKFKQDLFIAAATGLVALTARKA